MTNIENKDMNRDPISGAPGSHPVGTGVGGVGGAAVGAVIGSIFGPIGTLIGGAVGTLAGAQAGHSAAERMDPTGETEHWRTEATNKPYYDKNMDYDRDYAPAYRYGTDARGLHGAQTFETAEPTLQSGWDTAKGDSKLAWENARNPIRDAWDRSDRTYKTYDATDRHFEKNFCNVDYAKSGSTFEQYRPAYRYGTFERAKSPTGAWDATTESNLERGWEQSKGNSNLAWADAKAAVRDAWHGVERILPGDADHDGR